MFIRFDRMYTNVTGGRTGRQTQSCTTLDPTRGSGRVGSENLQERAGRVASVPFRPEA